MTRLPHLADVGYNEKVPSGSNSAVECDLAKVEVAGSNPVSRSRKSLYFLDHKGAKAEIFLFVFFGISVVQSSSGSPRRARTFDEFEVEAQGSVRIVE